MILRDWLSLLLILQAVLWPLCLTTHWSVVQAGWLDAAVAAWSLLVGAVVAGGGMSSRGIVRSVAMAVCLVIVLGEPLTAWAVPALYGNAWASFVSPLAALWSLTARPHEWQLGICGVQTLAVAAMAIVAWVALFIATRSRHLVN